jgi:cystathionine beta-lyase/cystathionine gamma-synthase
MTDLAKVEAAIKPTAKLMWVETPTNPTLKLIDIEGICKLAKKHKIITAIDDTFATPYLQSPLQLGADISVNSGTKYFGGHSDVVFGSLTVLDKELNDRLFFAAKTIG